MTTNKRLANGTKVHTNVALSTVYLPRSLAANINANVTGVVQSSWTRHRGEVDESVVYMVQHDANQPTAAYFADEFKLIAAAGDYVADLEGCIIMDYASAKTELEALEEILAKRHGIDSHVRERLIQMDINGDLDEDESTGAVRAWQEALTTFVNWGEGENQTPPDPDDNSINATGPCPTTQRSLPPIVTQWDHAKYLDGQYSVYPGHPLTIAYVISVAFPALADALAKHGDYPAHEALADVRIPGAGSAVWNGIDFLTRVRDGVCTPEQAIEWAENQWRHDTSNGHLSAYQPGQAQADKVRDLHLAEIVAFARSVDHATKEKP